MASRRLVRKDTVLIQEIKVFKSGSKRIINLPKDVQEGMYDIILIPRIDEWYIDVK